MSEGSSQADQSEIDDEYEREKSKDDQGPRITKSDLLFTPEELVARKAFKLSMSKCCKKAVWNHYNKLTDKENDNDVHESHPPSRTPSEEASRMGVLYDPTKDTRRKFLQKKYAYLKESVTNLCQAPEKPYLRAGKPMVKNVRGRGKTLPVVARATLPEVSSTHVHPGSISYKQAWTKTFNSNFMSEELSQERDTSTQTTSSDIITTETMYNPEMAAKRDTSDELFDLEDIPLDEDGNPIGKSTGVCEWCKQEILPIPSERQIHTAWDPNILYCCNKYRKLCEEMRVMENAYEDEMEKQKRLIDIRPGKSRKGSKKKIQTEIRTMAEKVISVLKERFDHVSKSVDKSVDTFDLPWNLSQRRIQKFQPLAEMRRLQMLETFKFYPYAKFDPNDPNARFYPPPQFDPNDPNARFYPQFDPNDPNARFYPQFDPNDPNARFYPQFDPNDPNARFYPQFDPNDPNARFYPQFDPNDPNARFYPQFDPNDPNARIFGHPQFDPNDPNARFFAHSQFDPNDPNARFLPPSQFDPNDPNAKFYPYAKFDPKDPNARFDPKDPNAKIDPRDSRAYFDTGEKHLYLHAGIRLMEDEVYNSGKSL